MKRINIVMFWFMNDWGLYGRTYENIAIGLANSNLVNKVFCILPPSEKLKNLAFFELKKPYENLYIITPNSRTLNPDSPPYNIRQQLNLHIHLISIKVFLILHGLRKSNTILWIFPCHSFINRLLSSIPYKLLITQIVDNVLNKEKITETDKAFITQQYDTLTKLSDITITSSQLNYDFFKKKSPCCYLIENGLDVAFISPQNRLNYINITSRPKIGYLGFISERTDVDLLKRLAEERPEYDLIIAGPDETVALSRIGILDLPNVTHIKYVSYSDAPAFIRSLDVCLIPHRDTPFSQSMSPLKLFQYLGSGRPIVTTQVAGTERWDELIYIATGYDDFILKVDAALTENSALVNKRIEEAKKETWGNRINCLMDIIAKYY